MGALLDGRRRQIAAKGRPMTLSRPVGIPTVALIGFATQFTPDQLAGGVQQGDQQVQILADWLPLAPAYGRPQVLDKLQDADRQFTLRGVSAVYEASALIGFQLWVRG